MSGEEPLAAPDTADELRLKGNAAYKAEKLNDALELYTKALSLSEHDTKILSNISATKYELGDYQGCIEIIDRCLKDTDNSDKKKQHQLLLRRVKCRFYLKQFEKCSATIEELHGDSDFAGRESSKAMQKAMKDNTEVVMRNEETNKKLVDNFPFYRKAIFNDGINYDIHAQGLAEAAFTRKDLQNYHHGTPPADLSFFFGGIGDARHFYTTLFDLSLMTKDLTKANTTIRFTLVDIKPEVVAKNLIAFKCLHEALKLQYRKGHEAEFDCLVYKSLFWYIYCPPIMPQACYKKMRAIMEEFKNAKTGAEVLRFLPWAEIDDNSRNAIQSCFDRWLGSDGEIRKEIQRYEGIELDTSIDGIHDFNDTLESWFPLLRKETQMFARTITIIPPRKMLKAEPELEKYFRQKNMRDMRAYVAKNWKENVARSGINSDKLFGLDSEFEDMTPCFPNSVHRFFDFTGIRDIGEILGDSRIYLDGTSIDAAMMYFSKCAEAIKQLGDTVKIIVGDANQILLSSPERKFDAMYLSNIPEYTGGYLTQTICAGPRLKPSGYIKSKILSYPHIFKDLDHSLAEDLAIGSLKEAQDYYGLVLSNRNEGGVSEDVKPVIDSSVSQEIPEELSKNGGVNTSTDTKFETQNDAHGIANLMQIADYVLWSPSEIPADAALPRVSSFNRLIYLLFFKITLPSVIEVPGIDLRRPLTILSFLRVLQFLHQHRGIPAHWIDGVIEAILSGSVTTSARPPDPITLSEPDGMMSMEVVVDSQIKKPHPIGAFSTLPFVEELEAAIVAASRMDTPVSLQAVSGRLLPRDVESYEVLVQFSLPSRTAMDYMGPTSRLLALVFLHPGVAKRGTVDRLRSILHKGKAEEVKGIVVYSCFQLIEEGSLHTNGKNESTRSTNGNGKEDIGAGAKGTKNLNLVGEDKKQVRKVRFSMSKSRMDKMKEENWKVGLWRTDSWKCLSVYCFTDVTGVEGY